MGLFNLNFVLSIFQDADVNVHIFIYVQIYGRINFVVYHCIKFVDGKVCGIDFRDRRPCENYFCIFFHPSQNAKVIFVICKMCSEVMKIGH